MRDLSKLNLLRDFKAERRALVKWYGASLALEYFGVGVPQAIIPVQAHTKPVKRADPDAVAAIQALSGISRAEAQKQVLQAQGIEPLADTQRLVILCLNGKKE